MVLQKTDKKRLYMRQTESLLIFLGDLGGLIEILRLSIGVVIFPFITRQIMAAIASENYQVQKYSQDNSEYYKSKKGKFAAELTTESDRHQVFPLYLYTEKNPQGKKEIDD